MRPPFSAIEPLSEGVSTGSRGEAATASSRVSAAAAAGPAAGTVPCGVALGDGTPLSGVAVGGVTCCDCSCARRLASCGRA